MLHIFYKHLFGKDTAMKLINYSLKVGKKKLLENVNISFDKKYINHILGSNGAGMSIPIEISILFGNSEHPFPERKNMPFRSRVQPFI